jgi:hypothetical protein
MPELFLPLEIADVLGELGERLLVEIRDTPDNGVD